MSVRLRTRRDPETGATVKRWMIDIKYTYPDGRLERLRKVSPVQTKRGAEHYELELRKALAAGTYRRKEEPTEEPIVVPTLKVFHEEFLRVHAVPNNKPASVESKRCAFRIHIIPALGKYQVDQIGPRQLETFKASKLEAGLSPKTVNNLLTVVRKTLSVAVDFGYMTSVPKVTWLRVPPQEFDFFDFDEADRLLAAADSEWRTMILTGLRTGLRIGELLALRFQDIDLISGRLVVRQALSRKIVGTPKNGRTREVPLSDDTIKALKQHRHLKGELVFCDSAGKMLTRNSAKHPLWRACRRAGLREVGWHTLRHTFASHLVMRGVPVKTVQELLGHSTIEMTMRYAHLSPDARREAVQLLDRPMNWGTIGAPKCPVGAKGA